MIEDSEFTPEILARLREELSKVYPTGLVASMTDEQLKAFVRAGEGLAQTHMLIEVPDSAEDD